MRVKSHKMYSIIAIISVLLVFGVTGIMAYLQDTAEVTNVFTIGEVDIEIVEKTTGDALYSTITTDDITVGEETVKGIANLVPGEEISKQPYVQNSGKNPALVYAEVKVPIVSIGGSETELFTYTANTGWTAKGSKEEIIDGTTYKVYRYSYNETLQVGGTTTAIFDSIKLVDTDWTPADLAEMNDVQMVKVNAYAIQEEGIDIEQGYDKFFPVNSVGDITTANYGKYVNLGTTILSQYDNEGSLITIGEGEKAEKVKADWRVFCQDAGGVWLILADYLPVNEGIGNTVVSSKGLNINSTYGVYKASGTGVTRQTLIDGLKSEWNSLIPTSISNKSGVEVKGAIDLERWTKSWNANPGYTQLTATYHEASEIDNSSVYAEGYKINGNFGTSVDNNNPLYFPHKAGVDNCYGYWLASPSAISANFVVDVYDYGYVDDDDYDNFILGVRPAVYLPSDILLNTEGDVWTVAD